MNAEGEKIQHVVKNSNCTCDLLKVNASVSGTLENIMWLEFISYHKLKKICECCCECNDDCDDDCDKPKRNCCCDDCIKDPPCKDCIKVSGTVYKKNGTPANGGFVTASGNSTASTEICTGGKFILNGIKPCDKIIINASSEGKTDSFVLKPPLQKSYQIDFFL